jgi:DNA ligase-1
MIDAPPTKRLRRRQVLDDSDDDEKPSVASTTIDQPQKIDVDDDVAPSLDSPRSVVASPKKRPASPKKKVIGSPKQSPAKKPAIAVVSNADDDEKSIENSIVNKKIESDDEDEEDEDDDDDDDDEVTEEVDENADGQAAKSTTATASSSSKGKASSGKKAAKKAKSSSATVSTYHPINDASWKKGEPVPYAALAAAFTQVSENRARLRMIDIMSDLYRSIIVLTPDDLLKTIYLSLNKVAPAFDGIELGVGESLIMKAIADATGKTMASIKQAYQEAGDLGLVAKSFRTTQRTMFPPPPLTIRKVFGVLLAMAKESGNQSMKKKSGMIQQLIVGGRDQEAVYLVRSVQGKLRIGLAEKTVLSALARALVLTPPGGTELNARTSMTTEQYEEALSKATDSIRAVYSELPSYDVMIPALLQPNGLATLHDTCHLTPGIPVTPMLAQPTKGVGEVLDRLADAEFTCEWKYDGERAQVHFLGADDVRIYSRNAENHTLKYPDIIRWLPDAMAKGTTSFIVDSEVVAWDRASGKILPFQVLSTRARKNVDEGEVTVQVALFVFDLLYLNGESLLRETLRERRARLYAAFQPLEGRLFFATHREMRDPEEIQEYLMESVRGNCEGLMVKTLDRDATYEPSRRSFNWLKVKKDYLDGMGDSCDLVPIGAYIGKGKRTGVYGGYLLACYDDESGCYQSVCKIGTGFSDENLKNFTALLETTALKAGSDKPVHYTVNESPLIVPDVWLDTTVVWEVKAADLSLSPVHSAGVGTLDEARGIALRFPRFVRVRDDKQPEQATNAEQMVEMYRRQNLNTQSASGGGGGGGKPRR